MGSLWHDLEPNIPPKSNLIEISSQLISFHFSIHQFLMPQDPFRDLSILSKEGILKCRYRLCFSRGLALAALARPMPQYWES